MTRISASLYHSIPYLIFWKFASPMSSIIKTRILALKTPATSSIFGSKSVCDKFNLIAAFTNTYPFCSRRSAMIERNYRKPTKFDTNKIRTFHSHALKCFNDTIVHDFEVRA